VVHFQLSSSKKEIFKNTLRKGYVEINY